MNTYPTLRKDKAFWGMTATQFLGAFNDNVFKMLLLLLCADYVLANNEAGTSSPYFDPYQTTASLLFASAFVMFSGFAGYLSDRYRKRTIVVACKLAEILVMLAGLIVFLTGNPGSMTLIVVLFGVLFLMGMQSAFFGPSKYGVLPEMFSDTDLPIVNGAILGTTFVAIIFGTALAGFLKDALGDDVWLISLICVGLAILGTISSLFLRNPPAAQPELRFTKQGIFVEPKVWRTVLADRTLFRVLLVYSIFWFVGGVITLAITLTGQIQLELPATTTALFNASMGLGIGFGSVYAASISKKSVRLDFVGKGCFGLFAGLFAVSIVAITPLSSELKSWLIGIALFVGGFGGGLMAVPLQVFIQTHPPAEYKGRVIAVMNLMTWIGILLASVYYIAALAVTGFKMDPSWILLSCGIIILLTGLFAKLNSHEKLKDERSAA